MPILSVSGELIDRKSLSVKSVKTKKKRKSKITKKQSVAEVSIDFHRWKRTSNYRSWRKKQWKRQIGRCFYCMVDLRGIRSNVEHVIPRSKGGTNNKSNLVLACWKCNKEKNSSNPDKRWVDMAREVSRQKAVAYEENDIDLSWIVG